MQRGGGGAWLLGWRLRDRREQKGGGDDDEGDDDDDVAVRVVVLVAWLVLLGMNSRSLFPTF